MIENEELGLKVAEDKTEKLWIQIKEKAEGTIRMSKAEIEIQEKILELAETKIKKE